MCSLHSLYLILKKQKTIHNNFYNIIIDTNSLKIKSMWITSAWLIKQDLEQETYKRKKKGKRAEKERIGHEAVEETRELDG